jgi:hypothetical protein
LRRKRLGVAAFKIFPNGCATHRIVDDHEAPGLAQADGRRKARYTNQALKCSRRQRSAPKASNIAPPHEQVAQTRAEGIVEVGWSCVRAEILNLRPHPSFLDDQFS